MSPSCNRKPWLMASAGTVLYLRSHMTRFERAYDTVRFHYNRRISVPDPHRMKSQMSNMLKNGSEAPTLGPRLQQLRKERNLTLDGLARLSGVSRSMLSQIERGQANPTVGTVWALAEALHIDISELIGARTASPRVRIEVASPSFTPEIRSEDGLCLLKILSPAERVGSVEWYELTIAPGGALRSEPHGRGSMEHLTVIDGELAVEAGDQRATVGRGATARYPADVAHAIVNPGRKAARALLIALT